MAYSEKVVRVNVLLFSPVLDGIVGDEMDASSHLRRQCDKLKVSKPPVWCPSSRLTSLNLEQSDLFDAIDLPELSANKV